MGGRMTGSSALSRATYVKYESPGSALDKGPALLSVRNIAVDDLYCTGNDRCPYVSGSDNSATDASIRAAQRSGSKDRTVSFRPLSERVRAVAPAGKQKLYGGLHAVVTTTRRLMGRGSPTSYRVSNESTNSLPTSWVYGGTHPPSRTEFRPYRAGEQGGCQWSRTSNPRATPYSQHACMRDCRVRRDDAAYA